MLPSSNVVASDLTRAAAGNRLLMRTSGSPANVAQPRPSARGPLAQRVERLHGIGAYQAITSWSAPRMQQAFGTALSGLPQAWIGARTLPTPNGYVRTSVGPAWT